MSFKSSDSCSLYTSGTQIDIDDQSIVTSLTRISTASITLLAPITLTHQSPVQIIVHSTVNVNSRKIEFPCNINLQNYTIEMDFPINQTYYLNSGPKVVTYSHVPRIAENCSDVIITTASSKPTFATFDQVNRIIIIDTTNSTLLGTSS